MKRAAPYLAIFVIQALCAFFFVSDILSSVVGFRTTPISWEMREAMEIGAAIGLILGVVLGGLMLARALRDRHRAEEQLRRASGAFMDLLQERFGEWGLTPSEKDVALFAIKGMSTAEIAALRSTSEGTVKAQTNAIYRKAGVSGRSQLLSLFIEDLMRDDGAVRPMPEPQQSQAVTSAK
ncbi:LuxR C-terminal-related transcriptional regulator [Tabrizicola sp.]|uniref:helix-turn-helix transcriptional regulator n=1 Tax=Tabrizicola sp. TaxID=2005166 RepID=UPI001A44D681|nr:LuxR C-terminal-related transcriptional regulator [Tabrizicola sp.]MBL9061146.1 helix-turn-helix transcriptional regulator [Tabrizicola sp.]